MLGLTLREEFRGKRLKGTAIELSNDSNTGATQIAAQQFLEITYSFQWTNGRAKRHFINSGDQLHSSRSKSSSNFSSNQSSANW